MKAIVKRREPPQALRGNERRAPKAPSLVVPNAKTSGFPVGARLKALRKAKGVTLEALADKVGFTKGYLSKLETGSKVPPIATLAAIASALGVDLASLFVQDEIANIGAGKTSSEVSIVRAGERPRVIRGGSTFGYDYQGLTLASGTSKRMQPFIFRFPQQLLQEVYFEHAGEELMFVLSGRIEIEVGGERHELQLGDCIHFNASARHRATGVGGEGTALVVIVEDTTTRRDSIVCGRPVAEAAEGPRGKRRQ